MKHAYQRMPVWFILFLLFAGCEIINPEEEIPSYVKIDAFEVVSNFPTTGTTRHKISDAWIFVNDDNLGPFELPVTVPILAKGSQNITIFPGVLDNGIRASRSIYPFLSRFEQTVELERGAITQMNPVVSHISPDDAEYIWTEEFEDIAISLDTLVGSNVKIERTDTDEDTFEGNASGAAHLDADNPIFLIGTNDFLELPLFGPEIYMELHYKTSIDLDVGMRINSAQIGVFEQVFITLRPTFDNNGDLFWNKIYLNLTDIVNSDPSAQNFQIVFGANWEDNTGTGDIFIDNIKLIAQR